MSAFTQTSLYKAIKSGDVPEVKKILEDRKSTDINQLNEKGETYLHYAMNKRLDMEIIQLLIPKVDLTQRDFLKGNNVMDLVLREGLNITYAQLISQYVMEVLRDVDPVPMIRLLNGGWEAWPVLGAATEVLDFPDAGGYMADLKIISEKDRELHVYAQEGNMRKLKPLLTTEEQAACVDQAGMTLVHKGVIFEQLGVLKMVLEKTDRILNHQDNIGRTALHYAAVLSDYGHVYNMLKDKGGDETVTDNMGHTPAYYQKAKNKIQLQKIQTFIDTVTRLTTIQKRMYHLHKSIRDDGSSGDWEQLMDNKQYVTMCDGTGLTALHKAFIFTNTGVVEWILKNFPKAVDIKDLWGRTPAFYAAWATTEDFDETGDADEDENQMYKVLLEKGIDQSQTDCHGKHPKDYVGKHKELKPFAKKIELMASAANYQAAVQRLSRAVIEVDDEDEFDKQLDAIKEEYDISFGQDSDDDDDFEGKSETKLYHNKLRPILLAADSTGMPAMHKVCLLEKDKLTDTIFNESHDNMEYKDTLNSIKDRFGRSMAHYIAMMRARTGEEVSIDSDDEWEESTEDIDIFGLSVADYAAKKQPPASLTDQLDQITKPRESAIASVINGTRQAGKRPSTGRQNKKDGPTGDNKSEEKKPSVPKPKVIRPDPFAHKMGNAPTGPDAKYCADVLGAALASGLAEVADYRPRDPVEYLAQYLYKYRENIDHHWEQEDMKAQLRDEEKEFAKLQERKKRMKEERAKNRTGSDKPGSTTMELDAEKQRFGTLAQPPHLTSLPEMPEEDEEVDDLGRTKLHLAILGNGEEVKTLLSKGLSVSQRDNDQLTPRQLALNKGLNKVVEDLDNHVISLFEQAKHDYIEKLVLDGYFNQLPEMGERLGVVDMRERIINSLQKAEALQGKITEIFKAIGEDSAEKLKDVLNNNKELALARNENGFTPFQSAIDEGKIQVAEYLAKHHPNALKDKSNFSQTYLVKAVGMSPRIKSAVERSKLL